MTEEIFTPQLDPHVCLTPETLGGSWPFRLGVPLDDQEDEARPGYLVAVFTPTSRRNIPAKGVSNRPINFCPFCGAPLYQYAEGVTNEPK